MKSNWMWLVLALLVFGLGACGGVEIAAGPAVTAVPSSTPFLESIVTNEAKTLASSSTPNKNSAAATVSASATIEPTGTADPLTETPAHTATLVPTATTTVSPTETAVPMPEYPNFISPEQQVGFFDIEQIKRMPWSVFELKHAQIDDDTISICLPGYFGLDVHSGWQLSFRSGSSVIQGFLNSEPIRIYNIIDGMRLGDRYLQTEAYGGVNRFFTYRLPDNRPASFMLTHVTGLSEFFEKYRLESPYRTDTGIHFADMKQVTPTGHSGDELTLHVHYFATATGDPATVETFQSNEVISEYLIPPFMDIVAQLPGRETRITYQGNQYCNLDNQTQSVIIADSFAHNGYHVDMASHTITPPSPGSATFSFYESPIGDTQSWVITANQ